jgi:hypothetical protein
VDGKLARPKMTSLRFTRKLELFLRAIFFFLPENMLENIARPKRWKKRIKKYSNESNSKFEGRIDFRHLTFEYLTLKTGTRK